jgi:hypothetical protein
LTAEQEPNFLDSFDNEAAHAHALALAPTNNFENYLLELQFGVIDIGEKAMNDFLQAETQELLRGSPSPQAHTNGQASLSHFRLVPQNVASGSGGLVPQNLFPHNMFPHLVPHKVNAKSLSDFTEAMKGAIPFLSDLIDDICNTRMWRLEKTQPVHYTFGVFFSIKEYNGDLEQTTISRIMGEYLQAAGFQHPRGSKVVKDKPLCLKGVDSWKCGLLTATSLEAYNLLGKGYHVPTLNFGPDVYKMAKASKNVQRSHLQ